MGYKSRAAFVILLALTLLGLLHITLEAQSEGVKLVVQGDPTMNNGHVALSVSVLESGGAVVNLPPEAFSLRENERLIPLEDLTVEPRAVGMAVVIIIDRGGIAARNGCMGPTGRARITEAKQLATTMVENLVIQLDGAADDMVAVIGIGERGSDGTVAFWPDQGFSYNPVDRNLALNALEPIDSPEHLLRDQSVTTPLYEGIYRGLNWLTANSDLNMRAALAERQRMILILSDGIDFGYSEDVVESDILRIANNHDVIMHSIGLACGNGSRLTENSLRRFAANSQGSFWRQSTPEEHTAATVGLQNTRTYRQQYDIRYPSRLSSGTHRLNIQVVTERGADSASVDFVSSLRVPTMQLEAPAPGYTIETAAAISVTLPITANFTFADGFERPMTVNFLVNGAIVHTTSNPPYTYNWDIAALPVGNHTLTVEAADLQLNERLRDQRTIIITASPTATPRPVIIGPTDSSTGNFALWLIPVLVVLVIVLFILLYRTQGSIKNAAAVGVQGIRSATMKLTQKLGPSKPPIARLKVTRGPNYGQEYRLREEVTCFGRETSLADEVIPGSYVSGRHFSITYNAQYRTFYVVDHRSTNGTFINRQPLPPEQYVPLPFGSVISVGANNEVEMQFQQIMSTTKVLPPNP